MARTGKYGHHADGRSPAQRAKAAGYDYCAVRENIAYRTNTGQVTEGGLIDAFVQGWIESPPHRENILAEYAIHTGVAVATEDDKTYYAVQLFGRPKSAAIELRIRNESSDTQVVHVESDDSVDEFELPSRSVVKIRRCFPTILKLNGANEELSELHFKESAELVIDQQGLHRAAK